MTTKLRRVHALNSRDAHTEIACVGNEDRVFKNISSLRQEIKEEIRCRVARAFVVTKSALPFIPSTRSKVPLTRHAYLSGVHIPYRDLRAIRF
jgi:hypothetical protein